MNYKIFLPAVVWALTACSLNESAKDQIAEEGAYLTSKGVYQNTVAILYNYIGGYEDGQGLQGTCRGVYDMNTFASDEAMLPTRGGDWYDGGMWQQLYKHDWDAGHALFKNAWNYLYKVIVLSNRSLEKLTENKSMVTAAEYTLYQAEIRALRAMYYFYLMDLFGRVPLVTSTSQKMSEVYQEERSRIFQFVYDELTETAPLLAADNSTKDGDYYGRMTRPAAFFILAKLALNAEIYTDDTWTDGNRPEGKNILLTVGGQTVNAWQATVAFCDSIENMGYALEEKFENNFAVKNEFSTENIFVIPMDKNLYTNQMQNLFRSYHYRHAAAYGFTAENGSAATKKALEVFGYQTDTQDSRFGKSYYAGTVTDLNGDTVLDRSGRPLTYYPTEVAIDLTGSKYVETAGARMKKYEVDKNAPKDGKLMDNDIVLFRFADVLLMRAEAKVRNGQDGSADMNQVRTRAGMAERAATLENILDERLLELSWEGWRRQDLIRFDKFYSLYDGEGKINETARQTTVFPIPADVLGLNKNLEQNKGYQD